MFLKDLNDEMNITRADEFTDSMMEAILFDDVVRDMYMDKHFTEDQEEELCNEEDCDDEDCDDENSGDDLEDVYDEEDIVREN